MTNVLFEFYRGDTYSRDFSITGYKSPIDKIFFTVKENENDKKFVLQKTLENGITLLEEDGDSKIYNILIDAQDTDDLKPDYDYPLDIEIHTNEEPVIKRTIVTGTLRLTTDITRPINEGV